MEDYEALAHAFREGDIIYGLDKPRANALNIIRRQYHAVQENILPSFFCCCRPKITMTQNIQIQNDLTNAVWDPSKPNRYANDSDIEKTLTDHHRGKQFRIFLENHPRYNIKGQVGPSFNQSEAVQFWKKTSKAGLEFQLTQQKKVFISSLKILISMRSPQKPVMGERVISQVPSFAGYTETKIFLMFRITSDSGIKKKKYYN